MTREVMRYKLNELRMMLNDGEHGEEQGILVDIIKELDKDKGDWIPVSERLPEMGVRVLCACQANLYDVLKLTPDGWFYDTRHTYMFGFVRAWMPLPEPYKAEKGGE